MGIHSTTMQYEYDCDDGQTLATDQPDGGDETEVKRTCLLSCVNDACNTLTCCTEKSIHLDSKMNESDANNIVRRRTTVSTGSSMRTIDVDGHEHASTTDHNSHTHVPMGGISRGEKFWTLDLYIFQYYRKLYEHITTIHSSFNCCEQYFI